MPPSPGIPLLLAALALGAFCSRASGTLQVAASATAPDSAPLVVETVVVTGNDHTKSFVITREMATKAGSEITREALEYDKNRIYSLGLFNQVQLRAVPSGEGKALLVVDVVERWYIYPYPIFGIKDRDWGKLYYGLGLIHMNFRGRNEKLIASVAVGYDPWASLTYRNPFLDESGTHFFEGRIAFSKSRNRSIAAQAGLENFDERHFSVSTMAGKRWGNEHTGWLSAGYETVEVTEFLPGRTLSTSGRDAYPVFTAGYAFDTRDLAEYPNSGTFLRWTVTKYGLPGDDVDIVRYAGDARRFGRIFPGLVLAGRLFGNFAAAGPSPAYNRVFFGYDQRIRGHFREVIEGESAAGASSEIRFQIIPSRTFSVDLLPREFGVWRFGMWGALFADAGQAWFRGEPVALNALTKGYGAGLHFLLPFSSVLRAEVAFNEARRAEYILDVGAMF